MKASSEQGQEDTSAPKTKLTNIVGGGSGADGTYQPSAARLSRQPSIGKRGEPATVSCSGPRK